MVWAGAKWIVLGGPVGHVAVEALAAQCRELAEKGWTRIVLDSTAVTGCDRAGLAGLAALAHGCDGPAVEVIGARWTQFRPALRAASGHELDRARADIRALLRRRTASNRASTSTTSLPTVTTGASSAPEVALPGPDASPPGRATASTDGPT
jgi:ABC-type transporter Mla MlaB component